jgi:SHS2 domain-containing protein
MMGGYELFEIDTIPAFRLWGASRKEVVERALRALVALRRPDLLLHTTPDVNIRIHVRGRTFEETLHRFLSAVIFESDYHQAVFPGVHVIYADAYEIEGEILGIRTDHVEGEIGELFIHRFLFENGRFLIECRAAI